MIEDYSPRSGRVVKENSEHVNEADMMERGLRVGGAEVSAENPVPVSMSGGITLGDVTIGSVGLKVGTTDVDAAHPLPVQLENTTITTSGTVTIGAGSAAIGTVGVTALPALPSGANNIGFTDKTPAWLVTADSAAAGAGTVTKAAVAGQTHYIDGFSVAIRGGAAANDIVITIKDGTTIIYTDCIGSTAASGTVTGICFPSPIACTLGNACTLNITAGGTGVISSGNLFGKTR